MAIRVARGPACPGSRGAGIAAARAGAGAGRGSDATCSPEPGSGARDRSENVRRDGASAMVPARHGVIVLVPVIAPYRAAHDEVNGEAWVNRRWRCACGAT
ncbi:hypothetical protein Ssi02_32440 [Sinosporangium siamense]|uniref:APS kinase domain-containing protein n=1 Tax=Sinosporangium siamense TaxID=1367973 RepID=A0A919RFN2_9ACTN|nr:hypothetical protein Ssi02_32440 [Sinosporangium siamense]